MAHIAMCTWLPNDTIEIDMQQTNDNSRLMSSTCFFVKESDEPRGGSRSSP